MLGVNVHRLYPHNLLQGSPGFTSRRAPAGDTFTQIRLGHVLSFTFLSDSFVNTG